MAQCNARHPLYRKAICRRLPNYCGSLFPHFGQLSKGQWVTWDVADTQPKRYFKRLPVAERVSTRHIGRKSKGRCWYCGVSFLDQKLTRDHLVPKSKGGLSAASNLVLSCEPCNYAKADMSLDAYRTILAARRRVGKIMFYGESAQRQH